MDDYFYRDDVFDVIPTDAEQDEQNLLEVIDALVEALESDE